MKLKTVVLFVVVSTLVVLFSLVFCCYYAYHEVQCEYVCSFKYDEALSLTDSYPWFTLRSEEYDPWFSPSGELFDNSPIDLAQLDLDQYTYVVTVGRKLIKLEYSYSSMERRKYIVIPKEFVGRITLDSYLTNDIYIYRIPKMDIDCDLHNQTYNVFYDDASSYSYN